MRYLLIALILPMFAFAGKALDKSYYIRMEDHAKLRAEPSHESSLLDMAYPSLELLVVDEVDNWLLVEKAGQTLFMENGASYARLESGPRIETPYADLVCAEAPEFTPDDSYANGGYWSFNNNCQVIVRSPLKEFPSAAFERFGDAPLLEGPADLVNQVYNTLLRMLGEAPKWYAFVSNAIDKIIGYEQGSRYDTVSGDAYAHPHLKTVFISEFAAFTHGANHELRLAAVLVHEACHMYQVNTGMALVGDEYEIMCHALEYDFVDDMGGSRSIKGIAESALKGYLFFDW